VDNSDFNENNKYFDQIPEEPLHKEAFEKRQECKEKYSFYRGTLPLERVKYDIQPKYLETKKKSKYHSKMRVKTAYQLPRPKEFEINGVPVKKSPIMA
jgi:hypothetical protein